jgi:hypothetical protein
VPLLFFPVVPTPTYLQEQVLSQGACHKQDLILGKLSEVLYEVDCGRNNEPQIIHCDRLKRKVKQRLRGESERDTYPIKSDVQG